jgi:hypothetical protein
MEPIKIARLIHEDITYCNGLIREKWPDSLEKGEEIPSTYEGPHEKVSDQDKNPGREDHLDDILSVVERERRNDDLEQQRQAIEIYKQILNLPKLDEFNFKEGTSTLRLVLMKMGGLYIIFNDNSEEVIFKYHVSMGDGRGGRKFPTKFPYPAETTIKWLETMSPIDILKRGGWKCEFIAHYKS